MDLNVDTERLLEAVANFKKHRICVLGDIMLDRFIWGKVGRISPEAPVPVVEVESETHMLGGAANVLHNLVALGGQASICGLVGVDDAAQKVNALLGDLEVSSSGMIALQGPAHHRENPHRGAQPAGGAGGLGAEKTHHRRGANGHAGLAHGGDYPLQRRGGERLRQGGGDREDAGAPFGIGPRGQAGGECGPQG